MPHFPQMYRKHPDSGLEKGIGEHMQCLLAWTGPGHIRQSLGPLSEFIETQTAQPDGEVLGSWMWSWGDHQSPSNRYLALKNVQQEL